MMQVKLVVELVFLLYFRSRMFGQDAGNRTGINDKQDVARDEERPLR